MNEKYDVHAHHVLPSRTLYRDNIEWGGLGVCVGGKQVWWGSDVK